MIAIQTKFITYNERQPDRVRAWISKDKGANLSMTYDRSLSDAANHLIIAERLAKKLGMFGKFYGGILPNGDRCWLCIEVSGLNDDCVFELNSNDK